MKELAQLREPHSQAISKYVAAMMGFWADCKKDLSSEGYRKLLEHLYYLKDIKGDEQPLELPSDYTDRLDEIEQKWDKLQPYAVGLADLAHKWKLRAPWAVPMLVLYDVIDLWKASGMPSEVDMALEDFDLLFPWSPLVPALEISVPAWALILLGRQQAQKEVAKKFEAYEHELKAGGLKEYPSALQNHAKWWFEHYVHKKRYDEIAQEETYTPGGSLVSYARNIGTAVKRFSNLIGIVPEALE